MAFKIGFAADTGEKKPVTSTYTVPQQAAAPRKSVVQIYFADRHMTLAYYNDQFSRNNTCCRYTTNSDEKLFIIYAQHFSVRL